MTMHYRNLGASGLKVSPLWLGTMMFGDQTGEADAAAIVDAARAAGINAIDTADVYAKGESERMVGRLIQADRSRWVVATKVANPGSEEPNDRGTSRRWITQAVEHSLRRLGTDRIDLYLLHWRGSVPLAETIEAFRTLQQAGKITHYGVSNLDLADMQALWAIDGGAAVATNQVLYNLVRRGIEWDLLPWLQKQQIPVMAYSPIEQARLVRNPKLVEFARRHDMTPVQTALAWLLAKDDIVVIPKTSRRDRLQENLRALDCQLTPTQLAKLDRLFPPPSATRPLEMI